MSDLNLENIVGFKAVDKNGKERQVTVDEMTELVSARIVSAASEISTFAAAAAAGTDEFEDQLPQSDTFSWLRTLDGSKNPTLTSSSAAAKVLGELMFPKYTSSELNYGDLNEFKSPTIKTINRWSNPDFPKTNWPDEITYGTFIVEQINDVIRQTAVSESLCIRFYYSSTGEWSEWMIY
jgi:hypothetical protein